MTLALPGCAIRAAKHRSIWRVLWGEPAIAASALPSPRTLPAGSRQNPFDGRGNFLPNFGRRVAVAPNVYPGSEKIATVMHRLGKPDYPYEDVISCVVAGQGQVVCARIVHLRRQFRGTCLGLRELSAQIFGRNTNVLWILRARYGIKIVKGGTHLDAMRVVRN